MGSKKYPNEKQYEAFIDKNSGETNAETDDISTMYYFEIENDEFR